METNPRFGFLPNRKVTEKCCIRTKCCRLPFRLLAEPKTCAFEPKCCNYGNEPTFRLLAEPKGYRKMLHSNQMLQVTVSASCRTENLRIRTKMLQLWKRIHVSASCRTERLQKNLRIRTKMLQLWKRTHVSASCRTERLQKNAAFEPNAAGYRFGFLPKRKPAHSNQNAATMETNPRFGFLPNRKVTEKPAHSNQNAATMETNPRFG